MGASTRDGAGLKKAPPTMKISIVLALIAGTCAVPALAATSPDAPDASGAPDEKICRTEKTTESRIPTKRVCRTRAEWEQVARDAQKELGDSRRGTHQEPGNS